MREVFLCVERGSQVSVVFPDPVCHHGANILHEIRKRKANSIGHILRRNCLLKQVIEGKIKGEMEVTRR